MAARNNRASQLPKPEINDAQARVLGEAFWNLARHYGFSRRQQAFLLGIKENRQRLGELEGNNLIPVDPDKFRRVGHLLGIHKNLRILYPHNRTIVYDWMKTVREAFGNLSAIDFVCANEAESLPRLFAVRRYLDQVRVS
jgi:hypothetical protein